MSDPTAMLANRERLDEIEKSDRISLYTRGNFNYFLYLGFESSFKAPSYSIPINYYLFHKFTLKNPL